MSSIEVVRAQALEVAAGWSAPGSPDWRLTAALFESIAADDELLAGLAGLPEDRLPALLASAAICLLIRRDKPAGLIEYFPQPGGAQPEFDAGFFAAVRAFVSANLYAILAECSTRHYQMNEVARCGQVALGLTASSDQAAGPVALVDIGTGAGLGLWLDAYQYRIGGKLSGEPAAGLTLDCQVRGQLKPPPVMLPPIAERVGIDIDPIDLGDPAAREWLVACTPPEASALARLAGAIGVVGNGSRVVAGDAVELLPEVLARLPVGRPAVIVDTYMAVFLPDHRRELLLAVLARASRARPLTWLSLDPLVPLGRLGQRSVQGIAVPATLVDDYQRHGVFAVLGAVTFDGQGQHGRLLARAHPAGGWVEWLDGQHGADGLTGPGWRDRILTGIINRVYRDP
jgi:hypothetical protein